MSTTASSTTNKHLNNAGTMTLAFLKMLTLQTQVWSSWGEFSDEFLLVSANGFQLTLTHVIKCVYIPLYLPGFFMLYLNAVSSRQKQNAEIANVIAERLGTSTRPTQPHSAASQHIKSQ